MDTSHVGKTRTNKRPHDHYIPAGLSRRPLRPIKIISVAELSAIPKERLEKTQKFIEQYELENLNSVARLSRSESLSLPQVGNDNTRPDWDFDIPISETEPSDTLHEVLIEPPEMVIPETDNFIKKDIQNSENSIPWFREQVRKRQEIEAQGKEFTLSPLKITLNNMENLTANILSNRQFVGNISDVERIVFEKMKEDIDRLLGEPEPPYKRTLALSLKLTVLYTNTVDTF